MADIMGDAFSLSDIYSGTTAKPNQQQLDFADEFGKAIGEAAGVVLAQSPKPIERINAVRLMSVVARIPAPALADPLVAVVNNPKVSDAEKLYAFQGLRHLLEQSAGDDPNRHVFGASASAGSPKLAEIGLALNNYVFQKRSPRDDKERAVIEFVRREAVAALARFKDGSIRKANRDLLYRPAWALARVMEQDPSVTPPFTIQEQMEAAIGLAQMKIDPDLNLDVAALAEGKVLLRAAQAANLDNERATSTSTLPVVPWKLTAARWSYALSVWRKNAEGLPKTRYPETARDVANAGIGLLTVLEKEGAAGRTTAGIQDVNTWGTNNPPKAWAEMKPALLFRDDPKTELPFPAAPADPKLTTPGTPKADPKKAPEPKTGTDAKKGPAKKPG
jgi:hypothetical protein